MSAYIRSSGALRGEVLMKMNVRCLMNSHDVLIRHSLMLMCRRDGATRSWDGDHSHA